MFYEHHNVKLWLCTTPTDMRKSFNGLAALAKNQLHENPLSGDLFIFINKKRNYLKLLYFDQSGYCMWAKKLEEGTFHVETNEEGKLGISPLQFKLLLEGWVEKQFSKRKRRKNALG